MISTMGDKATAKATMIKNGVPVVPGSDGIVKTFEEAEKIAKEIGFPVIIKATAGGGGRGMRVVMDSENFKMHSIPAAMRLKPLLEMPKCTSKSLS
jgi:acetyl-CoA carboxylase, biotin carboxylase subunit